MNRGKIVKWPGVDEKSEQMALVNSHTQRKSLQGKEAENELAQCLLNLFHNSSVQIDK